eukprot:7377675-Prymnesium_polylepis.2
MSMTHEPSDPGTRTRWPQRISHNDQRFHATSSSTPCQLLPSAIHRHRKRIDRTRPQVHMSSHGLRSIARATQDRPYEQQHALKRSPRGARRSARRLQHDRVTRHQRPTQELLGGFAGHAIQDAFELGSASRADGWVLAERRRATVAEGCSLPERRSGASA